MQCRSFLIAQATAPTMKNRKRSGSPTGWTKNWLVRDVRMPLILIPSAASVPSRRLNCGLIGGTRFESGHKVQSARVIGEFCSRISSCECRKIALGHLTITVPRTIVFGIPTGIFRRCGCVHASARGDTVPRPVAVGRSQPRPQRPVGRGLLQKQSKRGGSA